MSVIVRSESERIKPNNPAQIAELVRCERLVTKPKMNGVRKCGQPAHLVKDPWNVIWGLCDEHNEPYGYPLHTDGND